MGFAPHRSRRQVLAGLATASLALPSIVRRARAQAAAPIVVKVAGPVTALDILASYYSTVPQALYWKEEGLDVRMNGFNGANNAAIGMAAGQADVAFSASSALLTLRATHPEIDAVGFYTMITVFQSMPYVLIDSPIRTAADLAGKVIGVENLANSQVQTTQAIVRIAGKDPATLQFRAVGVGPEAAYALSTKRVDALALYDGLYAGLSNLGVAMRPVESNAVVPDRLGFISSLYALRSTVQAKREAMIRLGRGVAKASLFTQANPEAAVRIHWAAFPATKAQGVSEEEAMRRSLIVLNARLPNMAPVNGVWGLATDEQIAGYMDLLVLGGVLKQKLPLASVWDPSLLRAMNDFDREAVIRQARNFQMGKP